jgi:hypothetical protein
VIGVSKYSTGAGSEGRRGHGIKRTVIGVSKYSTGAGSEGRRGHGLKRTVIGISTVLAQAQKEEEVMASRGQ